MRDDSVQEIADALNKTPEAIEQTLWRGRRGLYVYADFPRPQQDRTGARRMGKRHARTARRWAGLLPLDVIRRRLDRVVDVNAHYGREAPAVQVAARCHRPDVVKLLQAHGAIALAK